MKTFKWQPVLPGTNQGYTLIEILIAMAIFSIGILAIGTLVLSTTRNNTGGNMLTQATMLARAKLEEKKREADAGALSSCEEENIDGQGNPGGIYTRDCTFSSFGSNGNAWNIQVTVTWTRNGRDRSVVLNTLIKGS